MLKETRNRRAWRGLAILGVVGVSVAAMTAWADSPPAENGLMTFPNVRVISMPSVSGNAEPAQAAESGGGFRAYVDPVTGRRVQPTREATAALNATARGQATLQAVQPPLKFIGPDGSVGIRRDRSHARNLVARVNADGTLAMACVPGEHVAERSAASDNVTGQRTRKGELK
jgi:hypothetical protein